MEWPAWVAAASIILSSLTLVAMQLAGRRNHVTSYVEGLERQIEALKDDVERLEGEVERLRGRVRSLEDENVGLMRKLMSNQ